ncbi:predicted protein [Uncinocarpus reesii 1704]|uniref:Uncharacterized protein n=1 Tax=Uncinocarpus reesii (strain UAMH 1704) TaxID=336963 RepID=C4JXE4_UNCRE|nr:uncharacterized protein UREG_06317 [Uncinocarpus reesii 1704]EEP81452.1 predicted protein [Uncinocarpus reesii 1704]
MDISQTVASWLSLAATVIGLGSIVTQFGSFIDETDPFHSLRDERQLGRWMLRQSHIPWYRIIKPPPVGPIVAASFPQGFCGRKVVYVTRLPRRQPSGKAAWAVLLAVILPSPIIPGQQTKPLLSTPFTEDAEKRGQIVTIKSESPAAISNDPWNDLPLRPLIKHKLHTCVNISRRTLIAAFCITNARPVFRHSGAAGFRAAYASYCGQWHVDWPLGDAAVVHFAPHDSHGLSKDVYPPTFERRVDKCIQMLAGVVDAPAPTFFKCAFPGRKAAGIWILQYHVRGYGGAHGSRHLYHIMGGEVHDIDFLFMKRLENEPEGSEDMVVLRLPSKESGNPDVILYVPETEAAALDKALDCLPWSPLSWSIHRGLRDILVAFAKERMDRNRDRLAESLRYTVATWPERLAARGWDDQFVRGPMADMAASAVRAGSGNAGDITRIVTDIATALWNGATAALDETTFWRSQPGQDSPALSPMDVAALVKCFILEWSNELDYQIYHDLPLEMYLG